MPVRRLAGGGTARWRGDAGVADTAPRREPVPAAAPRDEHVPYRNRRAGDHGSLLLVRQPDHQRGAVRGLQRCGRRRGAARRRPPGAHFDERHTRRRRFGALRRLPQRCRSGWFLVAMTARDTFGGGVAVITGAGAGIGAGLARHAACLGMTVVLADVDSAAVEALS